jgi:rubrerythrin
MDNGEVKRAARWDYDIKKFCGICEILDFAIEREVEAQLFFMKLSKIAKDPEISKTFTKLASEELDHEKKLKTVRSGKESLSDEEVGNLDIVDYTDDISPGPDMSYTDLMILGMKKEETSRKLYLDLASIVKEQELKDTFLLLAKQEAEHKLRFEIEYDLKAF